MYPLYSQWLKITGRNTNIQAYIASYDDTHMNAAAKARTLARITIQAHPSKCNPKKNGAIQ
jgi:hypothetical protein